MKKLLLILFISFLSAQSFAKEGDVYYCNDIKVFNISTKGEMANNTSSAFKLKWNKDSIIVDGLVGLIEARIEKERLNPMDNPSLTDETKFGLWFKLTYN